MGWEHLAQHSTRNGLGRAQKTHQMFNFGFYMTFVCVYVGVCVALRNTSRRR